MNKVICESEYFIDEENLTKFLLDCKDETWLLFKEQIPRDLKLNTAINLLLVHYIEMKDSGKVMMKILAEKHNVTKKAIMAKHLRVVENGQ